MEFFLKFNFFQKLWGSPPKDQSRSAARERLQSALVGDRGSVAPGLLDSLESEIVPILRRYMEIDKKSFKLALGEKEGLMRFSASVPVLRIHRQAQLPNQALAPVVVPAPVSRRKLRGPRGQRRSSEDQPAVG